jgi:hypothetical protein
VWTGRQVSRSKNSRRGTKHRPRWGCAETNCDWCSSAQKRRELPKLEQREAATANDVAQVRYDTWAANEVLDS